MKWRKGLSGLRRRNQEVRDAAIIECTYATLVH